MMTEIMAEDPEPTTKAKKIDGKNDVYVAAAECLNAVISRRASVKSAIFKSAFENKRVLLALTQKTYDHLPYLKKIVYDSQLVKKEPRLTKPLAYVLVYEFLFGNSRKLRGAARMIRKFYPQLQTQLNVYLKENGANTIYQIKTPKSGSLFHPRYVRANTLKTTVQEVIEKLKIEGFELDEESRAAPSQFSFLKQLRKMQPGSFFLDYHVPDLLVFHPSVVFHDHPLEKTGHIILQDKASCVPALLLNPEPGSTVLDACAAPGMKTSHLACLMQNKGTIFAVDIDETRCTVMKDLLANYGVNNAEVINKDFLNIDIQDEKYSSVKYILVDPTCSGSGVTFSERSFTKKSRKEEALRLKKLQGLQIILLKHALSFPNVERIVYSTCSINPQEDEEVLQDAMKNFGSSFIVKPYSNYLPNWKGCGKPRYSVGPNCLRAFPEKHLTNGFFVAVIERVKLEGTTGVEMEVASVVPIQQTVTEPTPVQEPESIGESKLSKAEKLRRKRHRPDESTEMWSANHSVPTFDEKKETDGTSEARKKRRKNKKRSGASKRKKVKLLKRLNCAEAK